MAPKKETAKKEKKPTGSEQALTARKTRSSDRRLTRSQLKATSAPLISLEDVRPAKKAKKTVSKKEKKKEGGGDEKGKSVAEEDDGDGEVEEKTDETVKTIVIEHCKQCKSFKTRADEVKSGLEEGFPGVKVILNPDKPRRGCFEIREEKGETFISLLDMQRPFGPMKELDMEKLISEILEKIKNV